MKTYNVQIKIMPLDGLLDPQGKVVLGVLKNLSIDTVSDVRVGKHITMQLSAESEEQAYKYAERASKELLANLIMEKYEITMVENNN